MPQTTTTTRTSNCTSDERVPLLGGSRSKRAEAAVSPLSPTRDEKPKPVPWGLLLVIWSSQLVPGLAFELIMPFINEMILHVGVTDEPGRVGFYSGIVESVFAVVQIVTSLPCGWLSDAIGRKPVVQMGTIGVAVGTTLFGLSRSFGQMIFARSLGGALCGSWAAMRTMLAESVDRQHHGLAFSGSSMAYRIGQTIGLPLGGFLAHPDKSIGGVFRSRFWAEDYPFALPCFVGGALALIIAIFGQIYVKETLPNPWRPVGCARSKRPAATAVAGTSTQQKAPISLCEILTPQVVHLLISNFFSAFFSELLFALYPLFAFTNRDTGGLGLAPVDIGVHLSIRAVLHLVLLFWFPSLNRRWGTMTLYHVTTALWPACMGLLWLAGACAKHFDDANAPVVRIILMTQFTVWSLNNFSWAALGILNNDLAPFPEARSRLNAVAQLATVVPSAIAPAFGTSLYAFSLESRIFNGSLVWVILVSATFAHALHARISLRSAPSTIV